MPMSNYSNFLDGVTIRDIPILQLHPGKVYWVNNSSVVQRGAVAGSNSNSGTYNKPLATITEGIARCTASRGDIIAVDAGHTETISAAASIAISKAGIAIVGVGRGSLRPTLTWTAAAATITVTAANVSIINCLCIANFADVATAISVSSTDCVIENCEFRDTSSILNFLAIVSTSSTSNACDGLTVNKCKIKGSGTTAATTPVKLVGTNDRCVVNDCYINLGVVNNTSGCVAASAGKIATDIRITNNRIIRLNTDTSTGGIIYSTNGTTSTGIVADNYVWTADVAAAILVTASNAGIGTTNNLHTGDADSSGYVLPAIGVN